MNSDIFFKLLGILRGRFDLESLFMINLKKTLQYYDQFDLKMAIYAEMNKYEA